MATAPQRLGSVRLSKPGKKIKGKLGRPVGSLKKRRFEETKLGFLLKYETPLEFDLIMGATQKATFMEPNIETIEAIAACSNDPTFKKNKFSKYLELYRIHGLHPPRAMVATPKLIEYYESIKKNKEKAYIAKNIKKIRKRVKQRK